MNPPEGTQVGAEALPPLLVVADPDAWLARLSRHHTEDRGTIVRRRAVLLVLMGAPSWRIDGVAVGPAVPAPTRLP